MSRKLSSRTGAILLVTTIVIVLLALFAVLSQSSAQADLRMADKFRDATQNYYIADSEAQRIIAHIDGAIIGAADTQGDGEYLAMVANSVSGIDGVEAVEEEGSLHITFSIDIDENQELSVAIYTDFDLRDGERYVVESYKSQQKGE